MKPIRQQTILCLEQLEDRTVLSSNNLILNAAPVLPLPTLPNGSFATNQAQVLIGGVTVPGDAVRLETGSDNNFDEGSTVAIPAGHFYLSGHFAFLTHLQEGLNTLRLRVTDGHGNEGDFQLLVTLDDRTPKVVVSAPASGLATNHNPTITGQVSDLGSGVGSLQVAVDGGSYTSLVFDAAGHFSFTPNLATNGTADATHVIHLRAFDKAGNQSAPTTVTFVLDTRPPKVVVSQPGPGLVTNHNPTVTGQVSDLGSGLGGLQAAVDGGSYGSVAVDPTGHFSFTPTLATNGTADGPHVVHFRATDQAGNQSVPLNISFVLDTQAPTLVQTSLVNGGSVSPQIQVVTFQFSKALNPTTVTASNFQLTGPAGTVTPAIKLLQNNTEVQLTYPVLNSGSYQFALNAPAVTDVAGNTLGTTSLSWQFQVTGHTVTWLNPAGGDWDNPANWTLGQLPGANDDVVINVPNNVVITHSQGNDSIHSLVSANPLRLTGGTLQVSQTVEVDSTFTLAGGTLQGAHVLRGSGGQGLTLTKVGGTLDGVTTDANLDASHIDGSTVTIKDGLTLNGASVLLGSANPLAPNNATIASLVFAGTQTLGGTGSVAFGDNPHNSLQGDASAGTLTIGSGITVKGGIGTLSGGSFVNQGTIESDKSGAILITPTSGTGTFVNQGLLEARNGGILGITTLGGNAFTNNGTLTAGEGGTFLVIGNLTQGSTGVMNVEIGGANDTQGGTLRITGNAALAGTFDLVAVKHFVLTGGYVGLGLLYGTHTGTFDTVETTPSLAAGLTFKPVYASNGLAVQVT